MIMHYYLDTSGGDKEETHLISAQAVRVLVWVMIFQVSQFLTSQ